MILMYMTVDLLVVNKDKLHNFVVNTQVNISYM